MNHAHNSTTLMLDVILALALLQPTPPPTPPPPGVTPSAAPSMEPSASAQPTSTPSLGAQPERLDLHPGQSATLTVSGATGALSAASDTDLASVAVNATVVTVTAGARTGSDTIHLRDGSGLRLDVPLRVLLDAGAIPPLVNLKVTGDVEPTWLSAQVAAAVMRGVTFAPGVTATIGASVPSSSPSPGPTTAFTVPVRLNGNGRYFDVNAATTVAVTNVASAAFSPPVLYYDDDPEKVNADGVLFRASISAETPARLYYYHQLVGPSPRRIVLVVTAANQAPSQVQLTDATAGPNVDVMTVGHAVTRNFLAMKPRNEGIVLDLASGTPFALHDISGTDKQVVAGNIDVRVLQGAPVSVTVLAVSPGVDPASLLGGPQLPGDGHRRSGEFSIDGFGFENQYFTAGGADARAVYGARERSPQSINGTTGYDYGDYGVWHTVAFTLTNPTDVPSTAYLYFRPLGGIVRSSFLIDGQLRELGCVRVNSPYQLAQYELTPRSTAMVRVDTMTDGGSNYPAEVGFTATAPTPSPPPVSAPDGCFPKAQPSPSPSPSPEATP